jgi:hypothetical protein
MTITVYESTIETDNISIEHMDIYKVFIVKNVISYLGSVDHWDIEVANTQSDDIYFIIDGEHDGAFGHWVFESSIYLLELFQLLKAKYPTIKLHLKSQKNFKKLFCDLFNIDNETIVYDLPTNGSTCIFPSPISFLNQKELSVTYEEIINRYFVFFNNIQSDNVHTNDYLIMPRQTKENYASNERIVPCHGILNYFQTSSHQYEVLHTDSINILTEQINKLRSSKHIILTDGSPMFVNGLFSSNSIIIVLSDHSYMTLWQMSVFPKLKLIFNNSKLLNNNTVLHFPSETSITEHLEISLKK